jgi:hypothetical protein
MDCRGTLTRRDPAMCLALVLTARSVYGNIRLLLPVNSIMHAYSIFPLRDIAASTKENKTLDALHTFTSHSAGVEVRHSYSLLL